MTATTGYFGARPVTIDIAEDGIQTINVDFVNGHNVEVTSNDGGQTWTSGDRINLGVDAVAALLDEAEAAEPTKGHAAPKDDHKKK